MKPSVIVRKVLIEQLVRKLLLFAMEMDSINLSDSGLIQFNWIIDDKRKSFILHHAEGEINCLFS